MSIKSGENCCTPDNPDRVQFIALLPFSSWDGLCKWLMLGVLTFKSGIIHIFQPKPKTVEEMSKSENIPITHNPPQTAHKDRVLGFPCFAFSLLLLCQ